MLSLDSYNYFIKQGYNILPYADSRLGTKQTESAIKKSILNARI